MRDAEAAAPILSTPRGPEKSEAAASVRAAQLVEFLAKRRFWFRVSVAGVLVLGLLGATVATLVSLNRDRWAAETAFAKALCATREAGEGSQPPEGLLLVWERFVSNHASTVESFDDFDRGDLDWLINAHEASIRGDALWADMAWGERVERFENSQTLTKFKNLLGEPRCG